MWVENSRFKVRPARTGADAYISFFAHGALPKKILLVAYPTKDSWLKIMVKLILFHGLILSSGIAKSLALK
jgi:hypothetical protein